MLYLLQWLEVCTINTSEFPSSLAELLCQLDQNGIQDHRRYQAMRTFLNVRARAAGIPLNGTFELTPLCNLDCKMCYVHLTNAQLNGADLLSADQWEHLIGQAIDAGMMYAKLTGGECLSYPAFKRIYQYLQERGVETGILTNGTLLDQDMADFLQSNPPASIQITLYGASEEAYERVTGHRVFSIVMENLKRLQTYGLPLSITVTPNAFMTDGEDLLRLVHSMGLTPQINCGLMAPRAETGRRKSDTGLDTYVQMFKLNRALGGGVPTAPCDEDTLPEPGGAAETALYGIPCGAGRSGFSIAWNGEMRPCNTFPHIKEYPLKLGFSQAWQRIQKQAICFPIPAECAQCAYRACCSCCIAEHVAEAPIGHASPTICARTRRMVAEGLIQSSII